MAFRSQAAFIDAQDLHGLGNFDRQHVAMMMVRVIFKAALARMSRGSKPSTVPKWNRIATRALPYEAVSQPTRTSLNECN